MTDIQPLKQELDQLRARLADVQAQLESAETNGEAAASTDWAPRGFYGAYYATSGFMLGAIAAIVSLVVNVIGAPLAGKTPLELIRVYLTFPLGEQALALTTGSKDIYTIPDGMILSIGCCLYLATGMLLGVPFYVVLMKLAEGKSLSTRLVVATVLALALWFVNFYLVLNWLQPLWFGGNWITDASILPPWVAAVTHVVFGWTMAVLAPWGKFVPYVPPHAEN